MDQMETLPYEPAPPPPTSFEQVVVEEWCWKIMYVLEIGVKCLMLQGNILSSSYFSFSITKPSQMNLFNHIPWRNLRRKLLPNRHVGMSSRTLCLLTPPGQMGRMAARVMMATVLRMRNSVILLRWGGYLSYALSSTNQFVEEVLGFPSTSISFLEWF